MAGAFRAWEIQETDRVGITLVHDWEKLPENEWVANHWETRAPDFIPRGMIQRVEWLEGK